MILGEDDRWRSVEHFDMPPSVDYADVEVATVMTSRSGSSSDSASTTMAFCIADRNVADAIEHL